MLDLLVINCNGNYKIMSVMSVAQIQLFGWTLSTVSIIQFRGVLQFASWSKLYLKSESRVVDYTRDFSFIPEYRCFVPF